ncbi:MAG: hypothetical protein Q8L14_41515 [Myxococcales bacterium]|nr:hypothetical protein [Myxococcales bacterium]
MLAIALTLVVSQAGNAPPLPQRTATAQPAQQVPPPPPPPPVNKGPDTGWSAPPLPAPPPPPQSGTARGAPPATSLVRVKCPSDCSTRVGGGVGRRMNSQLWEFSDVPAGKTRFDIEGFASINIASGYLDIPASSEVEVIVSKSRLALGSVTPRAAPQLTKNGALSTAPSMFRLNCQKPCTVSVDGARRTGENQTGQLTIGNVAPGTRQVYVKFFGGSAQTSVEVAPDTEVFLFAQESSLRVTNTRPLH